MKGNKIRSTNETKKAFMVVYNSELGMQEIQVLDPESFYPCLVRDPDVGLRRINKSKKNTSIHMTAI